MADEKKPEVKSSTGESTNVTAEIITALIVLMLVSALFNSISSKWSIGNFFSGGWGGLTTKSILLSHTRPISSLQNPIGAKVVSLNATDVYNSPGGKKIGSQKAGATGKILKGPVVIDGKKYWYVDYDSGVDGWVNEDDIAAIIQKSTPMSEMPTMIGGQVETSRDTAVLDSPGGKQIASEKAGARATIIEGPLIKDGVKYWHVKFEDGTAGWVAEDNLTSLKITKTPLANVVNPIGDKVSVSNGPTDVFADPGVNKIGSEPTSAVGEVIDGPKIHNGIKYWKIKFEDGTVGWVAEADLDDLKIQKTPLSEMPSLIGGRVSTNKNGVAVYDSPGGKQIATENSGTMGTITEGPLVKDGVEYWHVKFDNGDDGWVSEYDLNYLQDTDLSWYEKIIINLPSIVWFLKLFAILFSVLCVLYIVYLNYKISPILETERELLYPVSTEEKNVINPKWARIESHIESMNENDWRIAIIEADIMLGELLEKLSLPGDTIGDKLKAVEKSDFRTLDDAWDAHKIRNKISHDGQTFKINQRDAKVAIGLYGNVFKEFQII